VHYSVLGDGEFGKSLIRFLAISLTISIIKLRLITLIGREIYRNFPKMNARLAAGTPLEFNKASDDTISSNHYTKPPTSRN
jgi:hypothetical protein